jgi:hypothetical protein
MCPGDYGTIRKQDLRRHSVFFTNSVSPLPRQHVPATPDAPYFNFAVSLLSDLTAQIGYMVVDISVGRPQSASQRALG